jgi:hypothetical protein
MAFWREQSNRSSTVSVRLPSTALPEWAWRRSVGARGVLLQAEAEDIHAILEHEGVRVIATHAARFQ